VPQQARCRRQRPGAACPSGACAISGRSGGAARRGAACAGDSGGSSGCYPGRYVRLAPALLTLEADVDRTIEAVASLSLRCAAITQHDQHGRQLVPLSSHYRASLNALERGNVVAADWPLLE